MDDLDSRVLIHPRNLRPIVVDGKPALGQSVHCVSCGHPGGLVTADLPDTVIYLCGTDNGCGCDCEGRFGVPPEMFTPRPDLDGKRVT